MGLYGIAIFFLLSTYIYGFTNADILYFTVFTFIEYIFFTALLCFNISERKARLVIFIFSVLFVVFQVVAYLIMAGSKSGSSVILDSIPVGVETILIFIYIALFFYENFKSPSESYIYTKSGFWISIGMLIYLGGSFFFNILANHIDKSQVVKYWYLTYIADIIKNLFFCIAIIIYTRFPYKNKSLQNSSIPFLDLDMN